MRWVIGRRCILGVGMLVLSRFVVRSGITDELEVDASPFLSTYHDFCAAPPPNLSILANYII